jgi:hypothetical protein
VAGLAHASEKEHRMSRDESQTATPPAQEDPSSQLFELLTVADVAALLKVSRSADSSSRRARGWDFLEQPG